MPLLWQWAGRGRGLAAFGPWGERDAVDRCPSSPLLGAEAASRRRVGRGGRPAVGIKFSLRSAAGVFPRFDTGAVLAAECQLFPALNSL